MIALKIALISAGGALGANARYWLGALLTSGKDPSLPWPTFAVNVSGSLVAGVVSAWLARWMPGSHWRLFILVGFLGGYTTLSALEVESCALWLRGARVQAIVYSTATLFVGFLAAALGILAGGALPGPSSPESPAAHRCPEASIHSPDLAKPPEQGPSSRP